MGSAVTACGPLPRGQSGKWVVSGRESEVIEGKYVQKVFGDETGFAGLVSDQARILLLEISLIDPGQNHEIRRFGIGGKDEGSRSVFEVFRSNLNGVGGARYPLLIFDRASREIIEFDGSSKKFSPGLKRHFTLDDVINSRAKSTANQRNECGVASPFDGACPLGELIDVR